MNWKALHWRKVCLVPHWLRHNLSVAAPKRFLYVGAMSVAEIKAEIQKLTPQEQEELRDALEVVVSGRPKEPRTKGDFDPVAKPIWEIAEEIGTSVPPNDWEKVPKDGSINLDHYFYGHRKAS
jgi:hypothetical protein